MAQVFLLQHMSLPHFATKDKVAYSMFRVRQGMPGSGQQIMAKITV